MRHSPAIASAALLTAGVLVVAGGISAAVPAGPPVAPAASEPASHVLLVSLDGLNPAAIKKLGRSDAPHLHRLIRQGASTMNARTLVEETRTLPNHTSMLTGLRAKLPRGTGVRFNEDPGTTLHESAQRYVPGIFDVVRDGGGTTGMFVTKDKFRFLERSWSTIDRFEQTEDRDRPMVRAVAREMRSAPRTFSFLHLGTPDRVGHERGGMSPAYLRAVSRADRNLGRVLAAIKDNPGLRQRLLLVVTSDHGTKGLRHNDTTVRANYRVPFIVWGAGARKGADLYDLNPAYLRPGKKQPSYRGPQPIRTADVANLVASTLGLPSVAGSEFGATTPLAVD